MVLLGNPLGFELAGSVTGGIISALDRELTIEDKTFSLIQTDAAIVITSYSIHYTKLYDKKQATGLSIPPERRSIPFPAVP